MLGRTPMEAEGVALMEEREFLTVARIAKQIVATRVMRESKAA
jgi:hypothetical protein